MSTPPDTAALVAALEPLPYVLAVQWWLGKDHGPALATPRDVPPPMPMPVVAAVRRPALRVILGGRA